MKTEAECLTVLENGLSEMKRTAVPCAIASDGVTHKAAMGSLTYFPLKAYSLKQHFYW